MGKKQTMAEKVETDEQGDAEPQFGTITTTCNGIGKITVNSENVDVKFDGLTFTPAQIDHMVRLQRGGGQLRIDITQIQGELFENGPNG